MSNAQRDTHGEGDTRGARWHAGRAGGTRRALVSNGQQREHENSSGYARAGRRRGAEVQGAASARHEGQAARRRRAAWRGCGGAGVRGARVQGARDGKGGGLLARATGVGVPGTLARTTHHSRPDSRTRHARLPQIRAPYCTFSRRSTVRLAEILLYTLPKFPGTLCRNSPVHFATRSAMRLPYNGLCCRRFAARVTAVSRTALQIVTLL